MTFASYKKWVLYVYGILLSCLSRENFNSCLLNFPTYIIICFVFISIVLIEIKAIRLSVHKYFPTNFHSSQLSNIIFLD